MTKSSSHAMKPRTEQVPSAAKDAGKGPSPQQKRGRSTTAMGTRVEVQPKVKRTKVSTNGKQFQPSRYILTKYMTLHALK